MQRNGCCSFATIALLRDVGSRVGLAQRTPAFNRHRLQIRHMPTSPTLLETVPADQKIRRSVWKFAVSAIVVGLLATGIWFRIVELDHVPGLNGDEAWSGVQAVNFLQGKEVAWRTPTGNPLNVFFIGPLVLLHAVMPPSIALLRSVSVASGLLALGANFWLCRRVFDRTTAVVSTVLLAVLPVMIAYSRFAWDSSQTPLASVLVVYLALAIAKRPRGAGWNWLWLLLAIAAAVWVHPTNVFLLPLVVACVTPWEKLRIAGPRLIVFIALIAAVTFFVRSTTDLGRFTLDLTRLFSGATIYRFISGGVQSDAFGWCDVIAWCLVAFAVYGLIKRIENADDLLDLRLAVGVLLSLAVFFVVAGPRGVQPHLERYAIWTIVPISLAVSRGVSWWLRPEFRYRSVALAAGVSVAVGLLFGFERLYFQVFDTTGGDSHLAFRTADIDPKQRALQHILNHRRTDRTSLIVSESWWTYWPLAYLASASDNVRVADGRKFDANPSDFDGSDLWFVELVGSEGEQMARRRIARTGKEFTSVSVNDRGNNPTILVIQASARRSPLRESDSPL